MTRHYLSAIVKMVRGRGVGGDIAVGVSPVKTSRIFIVIRNTCCRRRGGGKKTANLFPGGKSAFSDLGAKRGERGPARLLCRPKNKRDSGALEGGRFVRTTGVRLEENKLTSHIIHSHCPRFSLAAERIQIEIINGFVSRAPT